MTKIIEPVKGACRYFARQTDKPKVWMEYRNDNGELEEQVVEPCDTMEQAELRAQVWQRKENKAVKNKQS